MARLDISKMTPEEIKAHKAASKIANPIVWNKETAKQESKREARNNEATSNIYGDMTIDEINRFNAKKNLPSSLK